MNLSIHKLHPAECRNSVIGKTLLMLICLTGIYASGQSPGGVAGASLWLRADQGVGNTAYINVPGSSRTASTSFAGLPPSSSVLTSGSSWSASSAVAGDYLTLDTGSVQSLRGVVTKGRGDAAQWVTSYTVSYSTDNITYTTVNTSGTPINFRGNFDQNTEIVNQFPAAVTARYMRITVTAFNSHPSMRADVLQSIGNVTADNTSLSVWQDQSGNNNSTFQSNASASSASRPVFKDNAADNINFNPIVNFANTQQLIDGSGVVPVASNAGAAAFVLSSTTNVTNSTVFSEPLGVGNSFNIYLPWAADGLAYWDGANTSRISAPWGGVTGQPYLWTGWNNSGLTPKTSLRRNGLQITSGGTQNAYTGNNSPMYIGGAYVGKIGDLIIYNRNLSTDERNRVESYVALKYGLTLDQTAFQNYLNSSSAMIWDAATNSPYNNNIAGIGRDDASGLLQKQSRSINPGIQPVIGNITVAASNTLNSNSFSSNMSSLVWGSDTGSAFFTTSFAFGSSNSRMNRVWKVQETGSVGTVKVALAASQLPAGFSQPALVVSSDPTFDGSDTRITMVLETIGGTDYYTATVDFATGQYFTFAGFATAPGGVLTNLNLWLKGDEGVSSITSDAGLWKDYSGLGLNASAATVANQNPSYNTSSNLINFNPNLGFSGSLLNVSLNINPSVIGDMSVFSISNTASGGLYGNDTNNWSRFIYNDFVSNGDGPTSLTNPLTNITHLRQLDYNNINAGAVTSRLLSNGYLNQTFSENNTQGGKSDFWIGWDGDDGYLNGRIGEMVVYSNVGNAADNNKVSSYLAVKYGITLGNTANPVNYTASNGTVMWNSSANSVYQNNIAGISRDDASALNQKQSQSVNAGLQPVIGNGNITDTNANNSNNLSADRSSLIWGSDTGSTFFTTPFVFGTSTYRMDRIWKVQETGTVGTVKVAVPVNQISGVKNLSLVVSDDTSFDGSDTRVAMIEENLGGIRYYTATVDFTTGQFYTFSGTVTGPGGVAGAGVWLRADAGSLSGTTNFNVPAGSRTGSTNYNATYTAANSTLASSYAWLPSTAVTGDYLTLDLGSSQTVNGVVTKGRGDAGQWVTSYTLSYSTDGTNYTDMGRNYKGNTDNNSEVSNIFTSPVTARYIRFTVTGFNGHPSLRADVIQNVTPATDTNAVANWTDQSGSGNHAMQAVASGRPTYRNNTTDNLNFNPVMNFNGSQNMWDPDGILGTGTYTDASAFFTGANTTLTNHSIFQEALGIGNFLQIHTPWTDGTAYWDGATNSRIQAAWGGTLGIPYLWTGWNNSSLTPKTSLRRNGLQIISGTVMNAYTGNNSPMYFGAYVGQGNYNGRMGDIIVFSRAVSAAERNRVESYMAIKYGLTLDQTTAQNYTNSASGIVWDTSLNAGYNTNIAGIMRDDASMLNQKQSKSSNPGIQPVIAHGNIAASNTDNSNGFTADLSSLLWGADTGSTDFITPFAFGTSNYRMSRIWKVQKTGTVGNVKIALPVSQMAAASKPVLIVSTDNVFDGNDTSVAMTQETLGGVAYYTANANLNSGEFFTFASYIAAPGGVISGLDLWVKGDKGFSAGQWQDLSRGGRTYLQANAASQPSTGIMNFNTVARFDGNDLMDISSSLSTLLNGNINNSHTQIVAFNSSTAANNGISDIYSSCGGNGDLIWNNFGNLWMDVGCGNSQPNYGGSVAVNPNFSYLNAYTYANPSGQMLTYRDNVQTGTGTNASVPGGFSLARLGYGEMGGYFNGNIGEYIMYNKVISTTDRQRIDSYLAIRYGITLGNTATPFSYLGADGTTTYWTGDTTYQNNIAGIGRDDATALSQKQSVSQNAGLQPVIGNGNITVNNAANSNDFTSDKSYLVWGSDTGNTFFATPFVFGTSTYRMDRIWKVQETGTVGTVKVAVPVNQITAVTDPQLVVSNDAVFDGSDNRIAMSQEDLGGVRYYTATVDLANGQFFTFSGKGVGPGGVAGAGVWLRADAGSLSGTTNFNVPAGSRTASTTNSDTSLVPANSTLTSGSSWTPASQITGDYLTLDLGSSQTVNGVVTKGRANAAQWVTGYTVSYSTDGTNYTDMGRTYKANFDQNSEVSNIFTSPVTARYIRFTVTGFNSWPSMRADVIQSVTPAADTNAVANWTDQSGSSNHTMQAAASGRPTYRNNITDNLNFNPVMNFNGSQNMSDMDGILGGNTYTDASAFVVNAATSLTNSSVFFESLGTGSQLNMHAPWGDSNFYWDGALSSRIQAAWGGTLNVPYLWTGWNNSSLTPKTSLRRNGLQIASGSTLVAYTGNNSAMTIASGYNGRIGDIIVFNRALSANERNRVDSYNAIKYGLTLDQTTAQNYTNSASGVIWDASANAAYSNNIAGIMRDDASTLSQKQAKSSSTGFQPVIGNIGISATNAANTNAFTADLSSLVWGSDTGNTNFATPFAFGNSSQRMTRIWKVQKTGTVGNVKVAIQLDQLAGNVSRPYLVVSNDATFDGSDTRTEMTLETIAGVQYYTATASFSSGQFYTFSALATAPGGVNAGLVSWNKQNTYNTGTIWKNALNTNDATGTGTISYNTENDLVNFNGSYSFNGSGIFTLPAALDVSNTYSVFGVSKLKTAGLNGRVFGSATGNILLGYHNNKMNTVYYEGDPNSLTIGTNSVMTSTTDVRQYTYIRNGGPFAFYGNSFSILSGTTSNTTAFRGTIGGSNGENSYVVSPEYITYNTALSAADQNKVESYLALKYGYTKSGNYISSSGTAFWTAIAGYNSNVAGIGRDDISGLEQKVSKSVNNGAILTLSTDMDFSSPNAISGRTPVNNDRNYLMVGDDNASAETRITTDLMSGFNTRLAREWRVQNTGFSQSANLQFIRLDLVNLSWHMVWDADGDFTSGAVDLGALNSNGQIGLTNLNTGYFALMANGNDSDGDGILNIDDLDDDNDGILDSVECPSATSLGNWQLNTNAYINNDEIVITNDTNNQAGQIWYKQKINVTNNFNYRFDIYMGNHDGADGVAFALQTNGITTAGSLGGGLGIQGVNPAMVVEFDTYPNDASVNDLDGYNHIAIEKGNGATFIPWINNNVSYVRKNLEDGAWHPVEINYVASTKMLEIYLDNSMIFQTKTDIANDFLNGATEAYMGFTGSTGGATNLQKIRNKAFFNASSGECDTDGDGIPNRLDLDSDNDGCVDALEGDENVIKSQLVTAAGTVNSGTGSSAPNSNICASGSCVDSQGVPILVNTGGTADIGNDQGQGIGSSQNNAVKDAECGPYAPSDDSDGDGIINSVDLDDDNDGILDTLECPTQFYWTGPVSFSPDNKVAKGSINGVGYTFTSDQPMSSTTGVFQHSVFPASYGVPNNNPTIRNDQISNNVMTFDQSLVDPVLVFASLGGGPTVPVIFDRPVEVVWSTCTGSPCSFVQNSPTQITGKEAYVIVKVPGVHNSISFKYTVAESYVNFVFGASQLQLCDTDGDGIPNQYDLDSDNDGCPDAVEGDENVSPNQLVTAAGAVISGPGSTAPNKNICASASCIDSQGVPVLVNAGGAADIGNDQGQGIGTSQNAASQPANCISLSCYKPAATSGTTLNTDFGISALGRAGINSDNWPMVRKGAWTALEAKTKGFVVNRVAFDSSGNPVGIPPANFIEGMMVYDTTNNCLKVYTTTDNGTTFGWSCMTTQTCPD
ncbi:discoidin domain-containing protein [uncultured Chryseobacterium sp.]|uniref:discoidin domain-containing protein n=1 Tax=uncultured Chryseobacterium sp. TaxID=259322 RepID=UPI0025F5A8A0|nr:discoidin domain-containing protein [uncultured Chryseobacterium sp.]